MATAGSKEARELERVKRAFDKAWKEAGQKSAEASDGAEHSNIKYHVSENFESEIDKTLSGEMDASSQVKARDYTPAVLVKNGVQDLPMLITQKHIKSIVYTEADAKKLGLPTGKGTNYHGLGKELLIDTINSMDDPVEIYRKDKDRYLIITELQDSNGDTVIVPVQVDGKGNYNNVYIDENQILSAYGKRNLQKYVQSNNFERIYAKKKTALNEGIQYSNIGDFFDSTVPQGLENVKRSLSDIDGKTIAPERISSSESDNTYSLTYAKDIAEGQSKYASTKGSFISDEELAEAQRVTDAMVDVMMKYSSILPEDKIGKVLTKNGSYDRSVENTTICVRTRTYNEFVRHETRREREKGLTIWISPFS